MKQWHASVRMARSPSTAHSHEALNKDLFWTKIGKGKLFVLTDAPSRLVCQVLIIYICYYICRLLRSLCGLIPCEHLWTQTIDKHGSLRPNNWSLELQSVMFSFIDAHSVLLHKKGELLLRFVKSELQWWNIVVKRAQTAAAAAAAAAEGAGRSWKG